MDLLLSPLLGFDSAEHGIFHLAIEQCQHSLWTRLSNEYARLKSCNRTCSESAILIGLVSSAPQPVNDTYACNWKYGGKFESQLEKASTNRNPAQAELIARFIKLTTPSFCLVSKRGKYCGSSEGDEMLPLDVPSDLLLTSAL
jgi:hypothetical protein